MLTNNKKSYFVKGIAMLMAMLMVLSVCLTGCGKKADEAIQKAEAAQGTADEAKTAADAVKALLADYLKTADGATKAEVNATIEAALAPYATTEALAAFVKSADFDKLVKDLEGYVTKAALEEALKGYVTDAEQAALETKLTNLINANKGNIDKALNDLKAVATDAEVAAIKKALEDKIAAADKAAADAAAALKGYVKNDDDYARLVASVQENTMKLMTLDREHYSMVMETLTAELQAYVKAEDYELLAGSVKTLGDNLWELQMNAKEQIANLTNELDLVEARVQALDAALTELHMNVKNELTNYVKVDTFELLTARVEAIALNTEDLRVAIRGELVNYATKVEVEALDGRLDKLEEVVRAILDAFYTKEEVETLAGSAFEDLLDMDAATITTMIKDKMSLTEWNKTTPVVIETIDNIQTLLSKIYNDTQTGLRDAYTDAAKAEINKHLAPLNIVMFDAAGSVTAYNKNAKHLEYTILRVATLAELEELKNAIAKANAVKNFKEELADLYNNELFAIGDTHTADSKKTVQTVTIDHKADINDFVDKYDDLIMKYINDGAYDDTIYEATYGTQATMYVWKHPTTGALIVSAKEGSSAANTYKTTESGKEVVWTKVDRTILVAAEGATWKAKDAYGLYYLPTDIVEYNWAAGSVVTDKITGNYGSQNLNVAETYKDAEDTYKALNQQIKDAQDLINTANDVMAKFLSGSVKKYGSVKVNGQDDALVDNTTVSDAQYLEALTVGMCTEVQGDTNVYDGRLLNEVYAAMSAALGRNTCKNSDDAARNHTAGVKAAITKYDLYFQMYDKAWGLAFELYRNYAKQMLNTILYDYISVVDYTKVATLPTQNATALEDPTTFIGGYEFQAQLTNGFLNGFLNGTAFAGWKSYTTGSYAAIEVKKDFTNTALVNYYGALNGLAQTDATTHIVADPAATIKEYNEELRLYLTSSVQNVFTELRKDDLMETAKAKYNTNIAGIFNELLAEAVANLDEVYNRFLFEDFKADKINETYAYATEIANFYSGAGDTALIEAMEHYLTGYSVTAATAPAAGVTTNKLFPAEASLVNASLTTELAALTVNKFDKINGVDKVALTATNAMAQVVTIVTGYELKVENMAIKDNFQSYLDVATTNVARAYLNYMAIPSLTYDMINLLVADRNSADTAITIQKFQNEMGLIALDNYKAEYTKLLTLIAGEAQKAHYEYLTGKTWAQGEAAIKSTETHSYLSGINNVVKPVDALGLGAYGFVGTSIVSFDRTVNVNTKYTEGTAPNIVIKNLYE